ncbi:MAG: hypothetical protein Q9182_007309 [Xanthomendoza sp. 2 TL-2023]
MSRLALSDADKQARDWFVHTTRSLGCKITVDKMGNIFAIRPGRRSSFPPTCAGSHLDTQPTGGRYDGILGVCAGLEVLKVLHEHKLETGFPVGVVNWTNEEGARFPISMVASGVWAGEIPLERAHGLKEVGPDRRTMKQELERIGYLGEADASYRTMPLGAHFELHIGISLPLCSLLDWEKLPYTVTSLENLNEANNRMMDNCSDIVVHRAGPSASDKKAEDRHSAWGSGLPRTTDFTNRADALLSAAKLILHSHRLAVKYNALASTGIIKLMPGSTNTVPGWVQFSLDIRTVEDDVLMNLEKHIKTDFDKIVKGDSVDGLNDDLGVFGRPCNLEWRLDAPSRATKFDSGCISCVKESAEDLLKNASGDLVQDMISGAGTVQFGPKIF